MSRYESIYDILSLGSVHEAEEDSASAADELEGSIDDDFSIDTSLDDGSSPEKDAAAQAAENPENDGEQQGNPEEQQSAEGEAPADGGADAEGEIDGEEEIEANTDIFASLTAEEQQVKIKELKRLYSNLYSSCDDILDRINKLDINEDNLEIISRVSSSLYNIKVYISDYLTIVFPHKSYIENDVTFVRFLTIIKSITGILEDIVKKYARENDNKD